MNLLAKEGTKEFVDVKRLHAFLSHLCEGKAAEHSKT